MGNNSNPIKLENHVILAVVLLISTFLPWVDMLGGGTNLWSVAEQAFRLARFTRSEEGYFVAILLYSYPAIAGLTLLAYFQGRQGSSKLISFLGGSLHTLVFLGVLIAHDDASRSSPIFNAFLSLGFGFYIAGICSVVMVLNYFGLVTVAIAQGVSKLFGGSTKVVSCDVKSEVKPQESSINTGIQASQTKIVSAENVKKAQDVAQKSLNIIVVGAEEFKQLVDKHGLKSFIGGIGLGVLSVYQPWLAGLALGGAVATCGAKAKSNDSVNSEGKESNPPS